MLFILKVLPHISLTLVWVWRVSNNKNLLQFHSLQYWQFSRDLIIYTHTHSHLRNMMRILPQYLMTFTNKHMTCSQRWTFNRMDCVVFNRLRICNRIRVKIGLLRGTTLHFPSHLLFWPYDPSQMSVIHGIGPGCSIKNITYVGRHCVAHWRTISQMWRLGIRSIHTLSNIGSIHATFQPLRALNFLGH